jgi:hypothetical protein
MENSFEQGQAVLIKGIVDYGNAKPGKLVRVRVLDTDLTFWAPKEDLIPAEPDVCDGGRKNEKLR